MSLIGTKQAAETLGVSQQRVQQLIKEGRLPAQLVGRDYVIDEKNLSLVSERKVGRPPKAKANGKAKPKKASKT